MKCVLLPEVRAELLHEVDFYSEARAGTGVKFVQAFDAALALIQRHPHGGAATAAGARAMQVRGFPFSVIYVLDGDVILIVALAGHRRSPVYWKSRLPS